MCIVLDSLGSLKQHFGLVQQYNLINLFAGKELIDLDIHSIFCLSVLGCMVLNFVLFGTRTSVVTHL